MVTCAQIIMKTLSSLPKHSCSSASSVTKSIDHLTYPSYSATFHSCKACRALLPAPLALRLLCSHAALLDALDASVPRELGALCIKVRARCGHPLNPRLVLSIASCSIYHPASCYLPLATSKASLKRIGLSAIYPLKSEHHLRKKVPRLCPIQQRRFDRARRIWYRYPSIVPPTLHSSTRRGVLLQSVRFNREIITHRLVVRDKTCSTAARFW